ncbi:T9SS type A sorting domain-containing protein [Hymenobacter terrenus]|uniref:T9SS type A sorting domain-containing protein n=1 Tax=Hymenobacter terrenus TaxID=1629124 RepID=UPI00061981DE|nr:T9SS type A sorting domain-containing protein [Hymenobacter terrenus]
MQRARTLFFLLFSKRHFYAAFSWRYGLVLVLLLGWLPARIVRAQPAAPAWQAALAIDQTASADYVVMDVATDVAGDVYIAGGFTGMLTIGSTVLTGNSRRTLFVAKWSPSDNRFVWAQKATAGNNMTFPFTLAVSGTSVYVAGDFEGIVSFGATTLTGTANSRGVFVAKLDAASGAFVWAQRAGSTESGGRGLAVSGANVYVAGDFKGTADFGSITLTSFGQSMGRGDGFVAKLVDAGSTASFEWAQQFGSDTSYPTVRALAAEGTSVYVGGTIIDAGARFGPFTFNSMGGGPDGRDGFVAKLTDAGTTSSFTWVQQVGGSGGEDIRALAVNGPNVYVGGEAVLNSVVSFGSLAVPSNGGVNGFVAKLTDAGSTSSFNWAQAAAGSSVNDLAVRGTSVYVGGNFNTRVGGTVTFGATTLTGAGGEDLFVAKLTDAGASSSFAWAQGAGGLRGEDASSLAVSGENVYVVGDFFSNSVQFGAFALAHPNPSTRANYLASLRDAPQVLSATPRLTLAGVSLYPNPARGQAVVQIPGGSGAAQATVTLINALGQLLHTHTLTLPANGATTAVPLAGLAAGLYVMRVQAGDRQTAHQLIVE